MPPSRRACLASSPLKRSSEFASNARNAAEMPEKASFLEEARVGRACRGHCTSNRRNPSDTVAVVGAHTSCSQFAPSRLSAQVALSLAQRLASLPRVPRLLLLTCGTQSVHASPASSDAAHGGVWGFARVLRLEHAGLRTQSTDMRSGAGASADAVRALCSERTSEAELAWGGAGTAHVRHRAPAALTHDR